MVYILRFCPLVMGPTGDWNLIASVSYIVSRAKVEQGLVQESS